VKILWRWIPIAIILTILTLLSRLPGSQMPEALFPQWDKVVHFIFFGLIALTLSLPISFHLRNRATLIQILLIISICSLIGALDEFHQSFVPYREVSFGDWLADTLGGIAGTCVYYFMQMKIRKKKSRVL
jgi:VanZ family protein